MYLSTFKSNMLAPPQMRKPMAESAEGMMTCQPRSPVVSECHDSERMTMAPRKYTGTLSRLDVILSWPKAPMIVGKYSETE